MEIVCSFVSVVTTAMGDLLALLGAQLLAVLATVVAILTLALGGGGK